MAPPAAASTSTSHGASGRSKDAGPMSWLDEMGVMQDYGGMMRYAPLQEGHDLRFDGRSTRCQSFRPGTDSSARQRNGGATVHEELTRGDYKTFLQGHYPIRLCPQYVCYKICRERYLGRRECRLDDLKSWSARPV